MIFAQLVEARRAARGAFSLNSSDRRMVEALVGKHHVSTPFATIEQEIRDRLLRYNTPPPAEHVLAAYVKHARTAHNRNAKQHARVMGGTRK